MKNKKLRPLIGITGFIHGDEVKKALGIFSKLYEGEDVYRLHIGVMTGSPDVMQAQNSNTASCWLKPQSFGEIFSSHPYAYNVVHYVGNNSDGLVDDLAMIVYYAGPWLNAVQLDMCWPDPDKIAEFRKEYKNIQIILQIGRQALKQINEDPQELVKRLKLSGVDYALLDLSMGEGKAIDLDRIIPFIEAIKLELPEIGIIAAGGFGLQEANESARVLFMEYPNIIGVDAESNLHEDYDPKKPLKMLYVENYLKYMISCVT